MTSTSWRGQDSCGPHRKPISAHAQQPAAPIPAVRRTVLPGELSGSAIPEGWISSHHTCRQRPRHRRDCRQRHTQYTRWGVSVSQLWIATVKARRCCLTGVHQCMVFVSVLEPGAYVRNGCRCSVVDGALLVSRRLRLRGGGFCNGTGAVAVRSAAQAMDQSARRWCQPSCYSGVRSQKNCAA